MQENPNQEKKVKKRYIEISLGALMTAMIIIALVIGDIWLGIYAYNLSKEENNTNTNSIENNIDE